MTSSIILFQNNSCIDNISVWQNAGTWPNSIQCSTKPNFSPCRKYISYVQPIIQQWCGLFGQYTVALLQSFFTSGMVALFEFVLTSYFLYRDKCYNQNDGVAMGSPLSPVVANLFMEAFEHSTLERAPHKPSAFRRYVDDTFIVWPHGREKLVAPL